MALSKIIENSLADEAVSSAKLKDFSAAVDLNGVELVLDADADTSITADTDDRIDFKIAGVEHFSFSNSSGDTIIKPMVDAKDIKFQQFDGRTLLDINDGGFVGIANGATSSGEIRFFEDTDNGSNYVGLNAGSISSSFTLTLPTADGSSGQFLKTDGSGALSFDTVSSAADDLTTGDAAVTLATSAGNITIDAQGGDTDIIFKGTDGSSDITMLTLDGSEAGDATFNRNVNLPDSGKAQFGDSQDLQIYHDGSNSYVNDTGTGSLIIEGANVQIQDTQQDLLAKFNNAGAVELYHVDSGTSNVKLATSATGLTVTGSILPAADDTHDLGSSSKQWRDIYTGDINLNNTKTRDNEVDGTRGSWTIQEGADDLFLLNRLNGKKYKFKLEEMK